MANIMAMEAIYPEGAKLTLRDRSLKEMIEYINEKPGIKEHEPICLYFPTTKKYLVYDKNLFEAFLKGDIEQTQLIEQTQCDGLFRNKNLMDTRLGETVDSGSLWTLQGDVLVLVFEDGTIFAEYNEASFDKVE